MQGFRVLLVADRATPALHDALSKRGLVVEQYPEKSAVFDVEDDPPDCIVVAGRVDTTFVSRVKTSVRPVPIFFLTGQQANRQRHRTVADGASVLNMPRSDEDHVALAARIKHAAESSHWSSPEEPESLYRTVVEQSHDAIFIGQDGAFRFWNSRLTELTGFSDAALNEMKVLDIIHPDDRDRVASISERRRGGENAPESYDVRVVDETGAVHECSVNVQDIVYRERYGVLVSMRDMTAQRNSEARFRALVEDTQDIVSFVGSDGKIRYQSPSVKSVLGFEQDELLGEFVFDLIHPDDREWIEPAYRQALETGESSDKPYRYRQRHADGSWRWLESVGSNQTSSALDGFIVTSRDVTEQQLRESQLEQYETIIENIELGVYVVDDEGILQFINEAVTVQTDVPREAFIGNHISMAVEAGITTQTQYEKIDSMLGSILAGDSTGKRFEVELPGASGNRVVDFAITPVIESDGEVTGAVGISTDITERKQYEARLNALHAASRQLSAETSRAGVADIVCTVTEEALEYDVNRVFLYDESQNSLVPTAATEAAENRFNELAAVPRNPGRLWAAFESGTDKLLTGVTQTAGDETTTSEGEPETHAELQVPIPDHGVLVICEADESNLRDHRRPLAKVLASNTKAALDRVEREQLLRQRESELARQNEQLESFASAVSHDLQNPLNVAMGFLELAQERYDGSELDRIAEAHERMDAIIQDVLALARNGQRVEEIEQVSLRVLALEAWNTVVPGRPDATLEFDASVTLEAHPGRLRQLLENLLSNAIRYGGDDVTVRIGPLEDRNGFYIEDDGTGIAPESRPRIFEAGYTTGSDGTGFGLSIVQSIVSAHGWSIWFDEGEDGGARFEITTESDR